MRLDNYSGRRREEYKLSCQYVLDVICYKNKPHFHGSTVEIEAAIRGLKFMNKQSSASGSPSILQNTELFDIAVQDEYIGNLTYAQCDFIIKLFSSKDDIDSSEIHILRTLITAAVAAVVRGVWKVYEYLQNDGYGLGMPIRSLFMDKDTVYLIDCKK
jgi:hypothetical protein